MRLQLLSVAILNSCTTSYASDENYLSFLRNSQKKKDSNSDNIFTVTTRELVDSVGQDQACPAHRARRSLQAASGAIISNGLIKLGVTENGALNINNPSPDPLNGRVGLRYIFSNGSESEATSWGCLCEGWGAGADGTKVYFNKSAGSSPSSAYSLLSFSSTATTAISSVITADGKLQVTHDFHPSPTTPNLYEVTVTLENKGSSVINDLRYCRTMDWDIWPTYFSECVTIQPDPSIVGDFLLAASSDGFASSDPYAPIISRSDFVNAPFTDLGPKDHGANFDFRFDSLIPGVAFSFNIYYGAAGNQEDAENALSLVSAEVYSFGKPRNSAGACTDYPNVFIFAFAGVGGTEIFSQPSLSPSYSAVPSAVPSLGPTLSSMPSLSSKPSDTPSLEPTVSSRPSASPSLEPTVTSHPSTAPSLEPTVTSNPTVAKGGGSTDGTGMTDGTGTTDGTDTTDGTGTTERSGKKKTKKPSPSPSSKTARPTGKAMKVPTPEADGKSNLFD